MIPGSKQDALALAKARWSQFNQFDLEDSAWTRLFAENRPGDVLRAVNKSRGCRDPRPEKRYESLLYWINKLAMERSEKLSPLWPPPGVTPAS